MHVGDFVACSQVVAAIEDAEEKIELQINQTTYKTTESLKKQLQTQKKTYALAKQLLDLVLLKFQLRVATIVDLKNAQESFENTGFLLVNLSYAAKAAEIEMKRLTYQLSF